MRGATFQDGVYVARHRGVYLGRYPTEIEAATVAQRARDARAPYRAERKERAREMALVRQKERYAANPELATKWQRDNPERFRELARKHRALKYGLTRWLTADEWKTIKEFYGNQCLGCGRSEGELRAMGLTLSPDHVIPLEQGGSCSPENIQPLCHARRKGVRYGCNNIKGLKTVDYRPKQVLAA